ncbi:MAG: carboxypeptidase regulatory-like domain-containing protein, partial [Phycisphaerales bacterium]
VAGVPVGVRCHKTLRENGRYSWTFSSYTDLKATTDKQGRFAIPIKEDGEYNLLFSPDNHAAIIVYDVPIGKQDLKVTLPAGGTVTGRLVRMDKGKKVPVPNAEVKIEQTDRASYTHLGFDRDRTTLTDSEGKFRFEHVRTKIRPHGSMSQKQWSHIPRVWQISYGETSKTIEFSDGTKLEGFELLVEPDLTQSQSLVGKPLPDLKSLGIYLSPDDIKNKRLLICFFDMEQRPSRNYLRQVNTMSKKLAAQNVIVVAVQASKMDEASFDDWCTKYNISIPVGMIRGDKAETHFVWGVKSLPWLILTSNQKVVTANGFNLRELDAKIEQID